MKNKIVHLLVPAFSENMLRVACRAREFKNYSRFTASVTCKNCLKTIVYLHTLAENK